MSDPPAWAVWRKANNLTVKTIFVQKHRIGLRNSTDDLERPWKNIRMDLKEVGIYTRNWVDSAQGGIIGESL